VNTIEALSNEVQQLEQALAQPDLDPTTEVAMRERHALSRPSSGTWRSPLRTPRRRPRICGRSWRTLNWNGRSCSP